MPKLKTLSGAQVVSILARFGFQRVSQRGSHLKLRRVLPGGVREVLVIPLHSEMDKGTLRAIFRQSVRYISEVELTPHFYDQ